jgi:HEAT repeats
MLLIARCPLGSPRTTALAAVFAAAITFVIPARVLAQPVSPPPLDARVVASVDRLFPGFTEVLESDNSILFARLVRTLSANPGTESLAVLVWMLEHRPSSGVDAGTISRTVRAVGRVPRAPLTSSLVGGNAEQRKIAISVLASNEDLLRAEDKAALEGTLIAALADPDTLVQELAVGLLRRFDSEAGRLALAQSLADPDFADTFHHAAMGKPRPPSAIAVTKASFPPATVAAMTALAPDFLTTLSTGDEQDVRRLLAAIERGNDPETTPVLVWLLCNGGTRAYGPLIVTRLATPARASRLDVNELIARLPTLGPARRLMVTDLLAQLLRTRKLPPAIQEAIVGTLISRVGDSNIDVRARAVIELGSRRDSRALRPIVQSLDRRDVTAAHYVITVLRALAGIGSRDALPTVERLARTGTGSAVRNEAVRTYVAIAKSPDAAAETRRLLWEAPDTALERDVLARGKAALPLAWQALTTGTAPERRAAAALLGWYPDVGSIPPILTVLDNSPGALTREQLLFDLNMILLSEGVPTAAEDSKALASAHLEWLYDQLANQRIDADIREIVLAQSTIAVFPDRVAPPFSVALSTLATATNVPGSTRQRFSATAAMSESPQAFRNTVAGQGCGVAFHRITVAGDVARVATTLYLPRGRTANQVWISLYRRDGARWTRMDVPPHPVLHEMMNEPNLLPAINRNYGANHPLKLLRLDLTMERIRGDLNAAASLRYENVTVPETLNALDRSYVPLLERYRRADSPNVRYTAEFELVQLTGQADLPFWIKTLALPSGNPFQAMARQVVAEYVVREIDKEPVGLTADDRALLVSASLASAAADPDLKKRPVRREHVVQVQRSRRFGRVDVSFGESGFSLLFERRGDSWAFLCGARFWIS